MTGKTMEDKMMEMVEIRISMPRIGWYFFGVWFSTAVTYGLFEVGKKIIEVL